MGGRAFNSLQVNGRDRRSETHLLHWIVITNKSQTQHNKCPQGCIYGVILPPQGYSAATWSVSQTQRPHNAIRTHTNMCKNRLNRTILTSYFGTQNMPRILGLNQWNVSYFWRGLCDPGEQIHWLADAHALSQNVRFSSYFSFTQVLYNC